MDIMIGDEIKIKEFDNNKNPKILIIEIDEMEDEYVKFTYKDTGHQGMVSMKHFRMWIQSSYIEHTLISFEGFTKKDD